MEIEIMLVAPGAGLGYEGGLGGLSGLNKWFIY